jgi:N-acetylglutamate synthase/N-acetylornithine aminotransferase
MPSVAKRYVQREELHKTIDELLETYNTIRIDHPQSISNYIIVRAWDKKEETSTKQRKTKPKPKTLSPYMKKPPGTWGRGTLPS